MRWFRLFKVWLRARRKGMDSMTSCQHDLYTSIRNFQSRGMCEEWISRQYVKCTENSPDEFRDFLMDQIAYLCHNPDVSFEEYITDNKVVFIE